MRLGQLMVIIICNIFRKLYCAWFKGLGPKFKSFSIYQPALIYLKPIMMSLWIFTLLKVCNETIKK